MSDTTTPTHQAHAPVSQEQRITILDSLRGIAILGILLMNIPGFALPAPLLYGDLGVLNEQGLNFKSWFYIDISIEGTQRALFSMLFGAGILLFINRKEAKEPGLMPADYFFRRQLWLLLFGLIHAFVLLWFWDVLFHYACCGMLLFAFRRLSPKWLIIAAVSCLALQSLRDNVLVARDRSTILVGEQIAKKDTSKIKLTEREKEILGEMTGMKQKSSLSERKKAMEKSLRKVRGNYEEFYEYQSERAYNTEVEYLYNGLWDVMIFMLLGMAFYKNGWLLGKADTKWYWLLCVGGLALGCWLTWLRLELMIRLNYDRYQIMKERRFELYEMGRALRAVGVFGLIMLLYKSGFFKWLFAVLRPVGQMAFTNYLMQSVLAGVYFYGIGFGMFGKLQRYEMYYVVGVIWLIEIIWSHIWLRFFRFGPLEWLWRSLTYWKLQPMRK